MIDLVTYGRPVNFRHPIVARVWRETDGSAPEASECVLITEGTYHSSTRGYRALLTSANLGESEIPRGLPCIHSVKQLTHLKSADVVVMRPISGHVRTLFRPYSNHNALLVTQRCNSFCLMCSQPPIDRDDSDLVEINLEAIRLMQPAPASLGITGGEPTLLGPDLFRILREMRERLPNTDVHTLTNGRRFAWPEFTKEFSEARHPRLTLGIPVYADNARDHDYVVQARGAFDQTISGLHQLARCEQPVEIRVVLHALTVPRLRHLTEFLYRNLPFAAHVALMGLEITGFTRPNLKELWVDPYDYQRELALAVEYLAIRGMNVSIYNHPLCVLPRSLWKFAKQSISDWKNVYFEICNGCDVRSQCAGFFKSATIRHSAHLKPRAN